MAETLEIIDVLQQLDQEEVYPQWKVGELTVWAWAISQIEENEV
jgi:hypothetical protein